MRRPSLVLPLVLVACSSSPSVPDAAPADRALAERAADRAAAELRRDLAPDQPRPPARWETVPGASLSLIDHTVTALANGDVLIVGGATDDGTGTGVYHAQKKAYRFLADQGTLVDAGELKTARSRHRAVLLADGRVAVLGGEDDTDYLGSVEIYDPAKPAAAAWGEAAPMPSTLVGFNAIRLAGGEVLVTGGTFNGIDSLTTVLLFKPDGTWKLPLGTLLESRRHHASVLLANGRVIVSGGMTGAEKMGTGTYRSSMEIYDPTSGAFTPAKSMATPRAGHNMLLLADGRVLIVGGNCGFGCTVAGHLIFDPSSDTLTPISHPGGTGVVEVALLVPGLGAVLFAEKSFLFASSGGEAWAALPPMAAPRYKLRAALVKDGSVLVAGGLLEGAAKVTHATLVERLYP